MRMLYIIGTDHGTQYIYHKNELNRMWRVREFAAYLETEVTRLHVGVIAEELSEEAVNENMNRPIDSNARHVAAKLRIVHMFCDPDSDQRKARGIPSNREIAEQKGFGIEQTDDEIKLVEQEKRKYWPIREKFWFDRIRDRLKNAVLFVCGEEHVRRFEQFVTQKRYQVEVLSENWYTDTDQITRR